GGGVVAGEADDPGFVEEEVGTSDRGGPRGSVAFVQSFAEGDAGFAEDAGQVAEGEEDAVVWLIVRGEILRGIVGPGSAGGGVDFGFFPRDGVGEPGNERGGDERCEDDRPGFLLNESGGGEGGERQDRDGIAGVVVAMRPEVGDEDRGAGGMHAPDVEKNGEREEADRPEGSFPEGREEADGAEDEDGPSGDEARGGEVIFEGRSPIVIA